MVHHQLPSDRLNLKYRHFGFHIFTILGTFLGCRGGPGTLLCTVNLNIGLCILNNELSKMDNSTMDKTEAQIVSYCILYLNPSSHQCQPSDKNILLFKNLLTDTNRGTGGGHFSLLIASKQAVGVTKSLAVTLLLVT